MDVSAKEMVAQRFPNEDTHRWNVEVRDGEIWYCDGHHDRAQDCHWVRLSPV